MKSFYPLNEVADMLSVSKETLRRWDRSGKLLSVRHPISNYRVYRGFLAEKPAWPDEFPGKSHASP
jgi:predicted site-specific integrase-resolvase